MEDRRVSFCKCGGYLLGDEFNDGPSAYLFGAYFDRKFDVPGVGALYECREAGDSRLDLCDGCPKLVVMDRSDSGAGMAGELVDYAERRKRLGRRISWALKEARLTAEAFNAVDMNP